MTEESESITGRDGYIAAQAFYWAIKFSQQQPSIVREWSNEQDMKALLLAYYPGAARMFIKLDEMVLNRIAEMRAAGDIRPEFDVATAYHTPPNLVDEKRDPAFLANADADDNALAGELEAA